MKFPIGVTDYREICSDDYVSVDKSLLIKEFLEDGTKAFFITRPRRFGKTSNLSMLRYFLDIEGAEENRQLFEGRKIFTATLENGEACMDHQGQYPVIFITFKDLKGDTPELMQQQIQLLLSKLYLKYKFLISDENANLLETEEKKIFNDITNRRAVEADLQESIKSLTIYLKRYYGKAVILLLDEYDTPMHTAYAAKKPFEEQILSFMTGLFSGLLKDNKSLHRSVVTGILRISLMNLFSGVNSVPVCSMLSGEYAEYFGFEEAEVDQLFKDAKLTHDATEIKDWYNGYQIDGVTLYNPWSIISCLRAGGETDAYWLQSGRSGIVGKALITSASSNVLPTLQKLLDGDSIKARFDERTIFENIETNEDALWSILLYTGYLKPVRSWKEDTTRYAELMLPNKEIKSGIESIVLNWADLPKSGGSVYKQLLDRLRAGNIDGVSDIVQRYIYETVSFYDFDSNTEERIYHVFMLGMLLTLKDFYLISSNKEMGNGRYDIILIPKQKDLQGIVFELKSIRIKDVRLKHKLKKDEIAREEYLQEAAIKAIEQIEKNKYAATFMPHNVKRAVLVGMVFYGKEVKVESIELDYQD